MPFTVSVRERCMYTHTLRFGNDAPFRTGCTAIVDATFQGPSLNADGVLIDITLAQSTLKEVMAIFDHKDLDGVTGVFQHDNTTVEVVAQGIFGCYASRLLSKGFAGLVTRLEITVSESDVAKASCFEERSADRGGIFPGLFVAPQQA